tara:strand:- start:1906 stop:2202 length:297 start_codon:yes stop_codon:yes gene_type:complete
MADALILKDKIEAMNRNQQIEVLRLLTSNLPSLVINENNNGTFINLTSLPESVLANLRSYVKYVEEQAQHLRITEQEMERLDNTYFKCNKETENTKIS